MAGTGTDLGLPSPAAAEECPNSEVPDVRIAPAKQDKRFLITQDASSPRETAPLRDAVAHQELICGFDGLKFIIVSSIAFAITVTLAMVISIISGDGKVVIHGAVSTSVPTCSDAGVAVLERGGNAIDAAVAAAFCVGVIHGQYSGLGGGGFLLVGNPLTATLQGFDFRETAPSSSAPSMFASDKSAALQGGLSACVPGEVRGLEAAWKQFGKLPWADLIQPSIDLAESGFAVTPQLAADIAKADFSVMSENLATLYQNKEANDTLTRPSLAKLLRQIAIDGSSALYNGSVAQEISDVIVNDGGILTVSDLGSYAALPVLPINSSYSHYQIYSLPAPSSGPELLAILHTLKEYNLSASKLNDSLEYHRLVEVSKFVAAAARQLGDPQQSPRIANFTKLMLSEDKAAMIRNAVNNTATYSREHYFEGAVLQPLFSTQAAALVTVVDNDNNIVSLTSSLGSPFGSGVMTSGGIILNNAMNSFNWEGKSLIPNVAVPTANTISPGRRPMSNMAPLMAWNAQNPCMSRFSISGTGRGSVQWAAVDVSLQLMSFRAMLGEAVENKCRLYPSLYENLVEVEEDFSPGVVWGLTAMGHRVEVLDTSLGVVNVASETKDKLRAHSDSRRLGAESSEF